MIGDVIKQIRREQGLTQADLSKVVNQRHLSLIETNKCDPGYKLLKAIIESLNYEIIIKRR